MKLVKTKYCFHCDKEIFPDEMKFMLGIDIPYINLFFHRSCYKSIDNIQDYILERVDKLIKIAEKEGIM